MTDITEAIYINFYEFMRTYKANDDEKLKSLI